MLLHVCREYEDSRTPRISLSAKGRDGRCYPDDQSRDPQDHGLVGHYTNGQHRDPRIMCAAIREEEKECVHTHCMHKRSRCNACAVEYTVLGQREEEEG